MPSDRLTRKALEAGRREAQEVLKLRDAALRKRAAAIRRPRALKRRRAPAGVDESLRRAVGGPATAGTLVAEGDSWFDYPLHDVLSLLEDEHGYDVESVAHKGDRVEEMAYGLGQLDELTRTLEKLLRRNVVPKAILLSGGGNDVAGDEFGMLLNHRQSPVRGLNDQVLAGVIDERVRYAYVTVLGAVTGVCESALAAACRSWSTAMTIRCRMAGASSGGGGSCPGPGSSPAFVRRASRICRSASG